MTKQRRGARAAQRSAVGWFRNTKTKHTPPAAIHRVGWRLQYSNSQPASRLERAVFPYKTAPTRPMPRPSNPIQTVPCPSLPRNAAMGTRPRGVVLAPWAVVLVLVLALRLAGASHVIHRSLEAEAAPSVPASIVSPLLRTGYHFQPPMNWINGMLATCLWRSPLLPLGHPLILRHAHLISLSLSLSLSISPCSQATHALLVLLLVLDALEAFQLWRQAMHTENAALCGRNQGISIFFLVDSVVSTELAACSCFPCPVPGKV
jgi:hypothetical protein